MVDYIFWQKEILRFYMLSKCDLVLVFTCQKLKSEKGPRTSPPILRVFHVGILL